MTTNNTKEDVMREFDEEFLTKSKCCNADVRKLLATKNNDLYCKTCGRFCKEIEKTKADEIKSFLFLSLDKYANAKLEEVVEEIMKKVGQSTDQRFEAFLEAVAIINNLKK